MHPADAGWNTGADAVKHLADEATATDAGRRPEVGRRHRARRDTQNPAHTDFVRTGQAPYVRCPGTPDGLDRHLNGVGGADPIQVARP